jgi:hypothetical protein
MPCQIDTSPKPRPLSWTAVISRIKREMDQPRLTESVRNGFRAQAAAVMKKAADRSALI